MRDKLLLGFGVSFVLGLLASATSVGCAESDAVGDTRTTSGGDTSSSSSSSSGAGGSMSSSSSSGSSSSSSSASSSSSGAGGAGGGGSSSSSSSGAGGNDPCSGGCPAGQWDVDGNPLTGMCGCEYACNQVSPNADPIDENFTDDNCDGSDGVAELCIYVSTSQGDDGNGGSRKAPMKTIAAAIQKAQADSVPSVCLSGEVYNEAVNVVSGINIYGGFDQNDADFKFRRSANATTTVIAAGTVFAAPQIDADTHIEGITIEATPGGGPGESTYGVRLGGGNGQLFVRYNIINVGSGIDGAVGMSGAPHPSMQAPNGTAGGGGCQGQNCGAGGVAPACAEPGGNGGNGGYNDGTGANGGIGSGGAPGGNGGTSTKACASKSAPGGSGSVGGNGTQGTPGAGGAALGSAAGGVYVPASGANGLIGSNGKGGGGGGGGGGGSCTFAGFCTCNEDKGGGGGSGGCGGLGGKGGNGGLGGGGSFGVFAGGGKVTVTKNTINSGKGGNGGKGGDGAAAQTGGNSAAGGSGNDDSGSGGLGQAGGKGGAGGPGGGGGGGPTACLGRAGGVAATFSMNSCTTGVPGFGGVGGTNPDGGAASPGNNGTAAPNLQFN